MPYDTGLILSGGAARGFAHIGILQALHELNIFPDAVSGVSAGSIVGALYCDGYTPLEILEIFSRRRLFGLVRLSAPRSGFMEMRGLKEMLREHLKSETFDRLEKPLWITVTNYGTGKTEYLHRGDLTGAILASCSIPVLFRPQKIGSSYYIDGGITDNFPVQPLAGLCNQMIGAYVNPVGTREEPKGIFQMALRSFQLSIASKVQEKKKEMTLFIEPEGLDRFGLFEVAKGREMYETGYQAAMEVIQSADLRVPT